MALVNQLKNKIPEILLTTLIFGLIGTGVYLNKYEEMQIDRSKLPKKVEDSNGFQRWITNLKNKDLVIEADEFTMLEENEIYNTKWVKVYSIDDEVRKKEYDENIENKQNIKKVIFSPSGMQYLDYRPEIRDGYQPNEVHHYGVRDNQIIDSRIVDCSIRANCYFDRAWFLDNDVFVITEISRNIDKKNTTTPICLPTETCTYTYKIHVVDLVRNSRLIYESRPFETILEELKPNL